MSCETKFALKMRPKPPIKLKKVLKRVYQTERQNQAPKQLALLLFFTNTMICHVDYKLPDLRPFFPDAAHAGLARYSLMAVRDL